MPKVSIGLPVYNGERYLSESFESLLGQTFTDFEIVVCDNASTDGTADIARAFAARDRRVRYIRNPENIGANRNYNLTMTLATGQYFKMGADDDVLEPAYIEKAVAILDANPGVSVAHSGIRYIDDDGAPLVYDPVSRRLTDTTGRIAIELPDLNFALDDDPVERFRSVLRHTVTCHFALGLLRMSVLRRTKGFGLYYSADRAFLAEMALYGTFAETPEILFNKREHSKNSRSLTPEQKRAFAGQRATMKRAEHTHLLRVIWRSPLPARDKVRCFAVGAGKVAARLVPALVAPRA
jgi:glycosyltransferase involved in cell wall biosynthesis